MASFGSRPLRFVVRTAARPTLATARVDLDLSVLEAACEGGGAPAEDDGGWLASSFDLRRGLRVSEAPLDTLPGELQDAFAAKR